VYHFKENLFFLLIQDKGNKFDIESSYTRYYIGHNITITPSNPIKVQYRIIEFLLGFFPLPFIVISFLPEIGFFILGIYNNNIRSLICEQVSAILFDIIC
jgi:hypothetical protein